MKIDKCITVFVNISYSVLFIKFYNRLQNRDDCLFEKKVLKDFSIRFDPKNKILFQSYHVINSKFYFYHYFIICSTYKVSMLTYNEKSI